MKNRIVNILISLSICIAAASSLASCGDRSTSESSASDSASTSSSSISSGSDDASATSSESTSDSASSSDAAVESSGSAKIVWTSSDDAAGDFDMFTATFKVTDGAADGKTEVTAGGTVVVSDSAFEPIDVEVIAGGVNIGGSDESVSAPSGPAIVFDTVGASAGNEVKITAKLVNCDTCTSFDFSLLYDSDVLELIDIDAGDVTDSCGQLLYEVK